MTHLAGSFVALGDGYRSLESCCAEIRKAQEYLAVNERTVSATRSKRYGVSRSLHPATRRSDTRNKVLLPTYKPVARRLDSAT